MTFQPQFRPGAVLNGLTNARLPRWALPGDWPVAGGVPVLADVRIERGRIGKVAPAGSAPLPAPGVWNLEGAPVLPGLVDAHTHIDKTFTLRRMGVVQPGLLGAIDAMMVDRQGWTPADVRMRASQALGWAHAAGVVHLRTHCDWWEPHTEPVAWSVLRELAEEWTGRLTLERVGLVPLHLYTGRDTAMALARRVQQAGPGTKLGGFVHTTNWNPQALRHLFEAAQAHGLDVDLHCDEELDPAAQGLATTVALLKELNFAGRVVCGHVCALAAQPEAQALATLDAVANAPITLVSLPVTNLLLQDAQTGRTPRLRGITLVKEARARGIPLLIASDNVQDPFCPVGSYDPVEALAAGVLAAQLGRPFDVWSESLCRADWLAAGATSLQAGGAAPLQAGAAADLVIFRTADPHGWPSRAQARTVLRNGIPLSL